MLGTLIMLAQAAALLPVRCDIVEQTNGAAIELVGACGQNGVMLGAVTRYQKVQNAASGAVAAVLITPAGTQVLVIHPRADGSPFVEDVTADLAKAAGRSGDAGLAGLNVDVTQFAATGVIGVTAQGAALRAGTGQLSVGSLIAAEASRQAAATSAAASAQ